jgi:hypothetical protein
MKMLMVYFSPVYSYFLSVSEQSPALTRVSRKETQQSISVVKATLLYRPEGENWFDAGKKNHIKRK